jgi:predicted transposase YdaD
LALRKLPAEPDRTDRWRWAKFFGSESDEDLRSVAQGSEKIGKAMLTIEKLSADEEERVRAEYSEMQRRDYRSRLDGAKREGRVEGRAEGRIEGRTEGRVEGRAERNAEIARQMKAEGLDISLISKVTGLPEEEIV